MGFLIPSLPLTNFEIQKYCKNEPRFNSNTFNYRHKIGEFEYIDIKDLINKIRNNTISEISAKKDLNTLNEIKNAGITKQKKTLLKKRVIKFIQGPV